MRRFVGTIRTDIDGSDCEFTFEVEDNATVKEIEEAGKEAAFGHMEWNYDEVTVN
ncbi:hypothetical protein SAMN05443270_3470 [Lacrimispora sphenoides]|uniref:hypothetical protein n=1 Tax=Lacrimispora sphenoides TaxID=29370 RepID=UPI0008CC2F5F|nr:hypothetical protein [Lacrimispora sphenoides]SEU22323.1 hypothetical protein SAMN05443270_3470 [Lacrimispora sphenoides]